MIILHESHNIDTPPRIYARDFRVFLFANHDEWLYKSSITRQL